MKFTSPFALLGLLSAKPFGSSAENVSGTVRSLLSLTDFEGTKVTNTECDADAVSSGSASKGMAWCTFQWQDASGSKIAKDGATLYIDMIAGTCDESGAFKTTPAGPQPSTDGEVTLTYEVEFADGEKNTNGGVIVKKFCSRADLKDDTEDVSVLAAMVDLTVTFTYAQTGEFTVADIATSTFDPETATAQDTRSVEIGAYQCNDDGTDHGGAAMKVGEQLHVCVYSKEDDATIAVTSMDLKYDVAGILTTITSPVGTDPVDGTANFVTAIAPLSGAATPADGSKTVQKVSTLLVPSIFDTAGGQQITAAGTVAITYGRRERKLLKIRGLQADAEEPFAVSFDIEENDAPAIAQVDESGGAMANAIGGAGAMAAVVAGALFVN